MGHLAVFRIDQSTNPPIFRSDTLACSTLTATGERQQEPCLLKRLSHYGTIVRTLLATQKVVEAKSYHIEDDVVISRKSNAANRLSPSKQ